jgi:hypothetical protein
MALALIVAPDFDGDLSVADDELARPVSLQLRSRSVEGSAGEFRLKH